MDHKIVGGLPDKYYCPCLSKKHAQSALTANNKRTKQKYKRISSLSLVTETDSKTNITNQQGSGL